MTYLLYGLGIGWALIILNTAISVTVACFQKSLDFREAVIILLSALGLPLLLLAGLLLLLWVKILDSMIGPLK